MFVKGEARKDGVWKNRVQDGLEPGCKGRRMQMVAGEWIQKEN